MALFACVTARSQDATLFGFTAGFNTLQFDLKQDPDFEFTPSLSLGILFYLPISEPWGLKLPLLLQSKGVTHHNIVEGSPATHCDCFSTVALQPQLHYNINLQQPDLLLGIFSGGQVGFVLNADLEYPQFDFAILAGTSFGFNTKSNNVYSLSIGYLIYPYTINTRYLEVTDNTINWHGVEILLSYEF